MRGGEKQLHPLSCFVNKCLAKKKQLTTTHEVVVSCTKQAFNNRLSALHAEIINCLQAIQLAVDLGISRIIVKTDAQEVVKAIKSCTYDASVVGHLVDEIKYFGVLDTHL